MNKVTELAMSVVRKVLSAYGFTEGEGEEADFSLDIVQDDENVLVINIDAAENVAAILIGSGGKNHSALQRICYSALGTRVNNKMPKGFFVTVNNRRPEISNGHSTTSMENKIVTITVPPGIEVRTRTEGESVRPRRR